MTRATGWHPILGRPLVLQEHDDGDEDRRPTEHGVLDTMVLVEAISLRETHSVPVYRKEVEERVAYARRLRCEPDVELALLGRLDALSVLVAKVIAEAEPDYVRVRGLDFPCEECGAWEGSTRDNRGFLRCDHCGYPSQ